MKAKNCNMKKHEEFERNKHFGWLEERFEGRDLSNEQVCRFRKTGRQLAW